VCDDPSGCHFDRTIRILIRLNDKQRRKTLLFERELVALADEVEERTTTVTTRKDKATKSNTNQTRQTA